MTTQDIKDDTLDNITFDVAMGERLDVVLVRYGWTRRTYEIALAVTK